MTRYEIVKFLHVLAVIVWVGGGVMIQILLARAKRAGPEAMTWFNQGAEWTSQRVFVPASFAALGFGIWLVIDGPWSFGDTWITLGLVGFAVSAINGSVNLGQAAKKMKELIASKGPADPGVQRLARHMDVFGRIDLLILTAVVFDMVVKPGL